MSKGYFSSNTQILLSNGDYKNISQLKPGDKVFNMYMKTVKVTKIHQGPKSNMLELRYPNWYTPLYCTPELKVLIMKSLPEKESATSDITDMRWICTNELSEHRRLVSEQNIYRFLLPKEFPSKKSYKMGVIFGLYAGYGSINNNIVEFRFGVNDKLAEQVSDLLTELFDAETFIEKTTFCYKVQSSSTQLYDLFSEFRDRINRTIPRKYWSSNKEYIRGLFDGLVEFDSNISRYIPITRDMAEIFVWICSLLGITFENNTPRINQCSMQVFPLFIHNTQKTSIKIQPTDLKLETWNLTVDCPTDSFIADNLVVQAISPD